MLINIKKVQVKDNNLELTIVVNILNIRKNLSPNINDEIIPKE